MPQFYLHIRNGPEGKYLDVDPDGMHLPNLDAARALAVQMARELWPDWPEIDRDAVIEIANETGQSLLSVPISEALDS